MSDSHTAIMTRHADGTVTVESADPVIHVSVDLLKQADSWVLPNGDWDTIQLDTAGEYRYRKLDVVPDRPPAGFWLVYERIEP